VLAFAAATTFLPRLPRALSFEEMLQVSKSPPVKVPLARSTRLVGSNGCLFQRGRRSGALSALELLIWLPSAHSDFEVFTELDLLASNRPPPAPALALCSSPQACSPHPVKPQATEDSVSLYLVEVSFLPTLRHLLPLAPRPVPRT